nr:anamorsin homolog [Tanacetum cinerariifolium]
IKAKKHTWKLGLLFYLKKPMKILPKVLIDDEMDLIDNNSLLSEEDLKKPKSYLGVQEKLAKAKPVDVLKKRFLKDLESAQRITCSSTGVV